VVFLEEGRALPDAASPRREEEGCARASPWANAASYRAQALPRTVPPSSDA
jgi:hypothetical protein